MRDELNCWDFLQHRGFTGREAALAIVGEPETDSPETLAKTLPVLDLMRQSYEGTRRWFANAPEDGETPPRGLLMSLSMQEAQGRTTPDLVAAGAGDVRFLTWLRTPMADFDLQEFTRDVLARWVDEVGATSLYPFTHDKKSALAEVEATSNIRNPEDCLKEIQVQAETVLIEIVEHLEAQPGSVPAPGIAENTSNVSLNGISTAQVAAIFDGLPYTAENWPKRLSGTKWLKPAQLALGAAGRATSLWCPAILAQQICGRESGEQKQKTLEALNRKFKNTPALRHWLPNWDEYYSMFTELDGYH